MDNLANLPDEVRAEIAPHAAESAEDLDKIGVAIAKKRDEAKAARSSSGIETTWAECEDAYAGADDANRAEYSSGRWIKPTSMDGPVTTGRGPQDTEYKSTAFIRLTARYVDAGAAKLGEILLPADDKAFSFSETPVPELIKAKEDTSQVVHDGLGGLPLMRSPKPGETMPQGPTPGAPQAPGVPGQVPLTVKDLAEEHIELARKKAKLAETRIYDWMVECQYTSEVRKVIFDAARIGTGVLKAPIPKASRSIVVTKTDAGGVEIKIRDSVKPAVKWVDAWNIFPDPTCGENINSGDFIFERDYLSERQLEDLKKLPGYIARQIAKVIEEGPDTASTSSWRGGPPERRKGRYEVWYYYGSITREEMDCIGEAAGTDLDLQGKKHVFAIVTLVNSRVIRSVVNPLDSGSLPYHSVPWQRCSGHWAGIGVAEQVRTPQKMINAANRAMLNNAGKSAGSQLVVDQSAIKPADGKWIMTPDKIWYKTGDSPGDDVRKSFMAIQIPNVTDQLMTIIEFALQLAEESTSIPLITQGQSGPTTPDTFGAAQLQNNNANQLLRSIGYAFDDYITEPVVRQFYEWLLLDPEVPDEEKGEFTINAHGSIALVERAIQDQTIAQMGGLVTNPAFKIDPKKWATQFLKSKRLNPQDFQYTEEQQAKIDAAPPPAAPQVQAAQIRAQVDREKAVIGHQADQTIAASEATVQLHELQMKRELALLDYANRNQLNLNDVKAELAKTAMTLNAQRELNAANNELDLHKHANPPPQKAKGAKPPAQAPGRAGNGRAFSQ